MHFLRAEFLRRNALLLPTIELALKDIRGNMKGSATAHTMPDHAHHAFGLQYTPSYATFSSLGSKHIIPEDDSI